MLASLPQTTPSLEAEPDPLGHLLKMIHEQGDIVRYHSGYGLVHLFNHPDHVQAIVQNANFERTALMRMVLGDGLLASDGRYWQQQRRLLQPSFHEKCIHGFGHVIVQSTLGMLRRWEKEGATGEVLELCAEARRLTLEIILSVLFGEVPQEDVVRMVDAAQVIMAHVGDLSDVVFNVPLIIDPQLRERFLSAMEVMDSIVAELTQKAESGPRSARGIVSSLLQARDEGVLTARQVRDEIVTMIIAGHETTAIALSWAMALLSAHADVYERLVEEVDRVLDSRTPVVDDLSQLTYLRMVLDESMRLYPPVSVAVRQAVKEDTVAGVRIPAGGLVLVCSFTTHRHPDFWREPERFDPERFLPERSRDRHRYAFFPFLGGRHQCIGQGLVMIEAPLILALLLKHVKMHMPSGIRRYPLPGTALRLKEGFPITVEFRKPLPAC
ncbi:cytochrome P450 [Roseimicrobium sp. ORNL1]|uniref:cytochrome P450 n=1 Tax=Roseimicrobium sp. ORNL1 TaxID=2711231 RepID=UPI0013E16185|nr:cytochrome P450 [Roseimicrobium sp. ORNL1]QIF00767.1 cytochrome P450 [Roseimicrobium sp. ORNL1]